MWRVFFIFCIESSPSVAPATVSCKTTLHQMFDGFVRSSAVSLIFLTDVITMEGVAALYEVGF